MADINEPAGNLQCIVVTPERTVVETRADFVALPMIDGELGVAEQHSPMIGRLGFGELRIKSNSKTHAFYIDGGFVQVADDVVSVLTNRAIPATEVDEQSATALLHESIARPAAGDEQLASRDRLLAQARGQQRVAARAK